MHKEEEEEEVQRDSKIENDCIVKVFKIIEMQNKAFAFIDSSCLVKRSIRRVMTFRKP